MFQQSIPGFEVRPDVLLLSIKSEHASRIFAGTKLFELRKTLPRTSFARVYLYQTGNTGIVGYFDVGRILEGTPQSVWDLVGELATPRERFFAYFKDSPKACAIEVLRPRTFPTPIRLPDLGDSPRDVTAPMSFRLLSPGMRAYESLEMARAENEQRRRREIRLRPIEDRQRQEYRELVLEHVGANYDDITAGFVEATFRTHDAGRDVNGMFTLRKEVLSVWNPTDGIVGYTTVTYKLGGAAKTGPTALLERFRGRGYGTSMRAALESHLREKNVRKIYATCPDQAGSVIRYLLAAKYRIEAHLAAQYTEGHGELVFGRLLSRMGTPEILKRVAIASGKIVRVQDVGIAEAASIVAKSISTTWCKMSVKRATALVRSAGRLRLEEGYESKPRMLWLVKGGRGYLGAVFVVPKRGGAAKLMISGKVQHDSTLHRAVETAEKWAITARRRKLFALCRVADEALLRVLLRRGYSLEGTLREPYRRGRDVFVASQFI